MDKSLDTPIQYIKGVGPKRAKVFNKLGIKTVEDLFYYFPRRYEDRTKFLSISEIKEGEFQTIKAQVLARAQRQSWRRRRFNILEVVVADNTGKISCVWFNQPYLKEYFLPGTAVILHGKAEHYGNKLQMNSPEFEIIEPGQELLSLNRIVPVYSLPEGMTQRYFRQFIKCALDEYMPKINDFLPYDSRARNNLLNLAKGLINIHFPESADLQKEAYERLSFEEFFLFQVPLVLRKLRKKEKPGIAHNIEGRLVDSFLSSMPFRLTKAQEKVLGEIFSDMAKPQAMQRLLQGDVGSGKTIVATIASLSAIQGGHQAVIMVPTEILARQHYDRISSQMSAFSCQDKEIKIGLLTSSLKAAEKRKIYKEISEGRVDLIIGTHALLEKEVKFKDLGLVVIDEQHKFGVGQRALLPQKGLNPDVLIMTATPIPRTLAITLYGDLDISVINELPPGRLPVKTLYFSQDQARQGYGIVKEYLCRKQQAYIVYPVIEESYDLDIAGARKMYEQFKAGEFKGFKLGLIHARLKRQEQEEMMLKFKNGELDILVATTVLEVGIDIANATSMVIQHAERFGLSQLHQLRGRVGRGAQESFCILISDAKSQESKARIEAMLRYGDGFRIAEEDLRIRGPGEFFGMRQHGLTELKIANPLAQMQLLKKAREEAISVVTLDPALEARQNLPLKEKLLQRFPEYEKLMVVG